MRHIRRTKYLFVYLHDGRFLDMELLLRGVAELRPVRDIVAISVPAGEAYSVTTEELQLLLDIPSNRWTPIDEISLDLSTATDVLHDLAQKGILLCDDPALAEFRRRDEQLSSMDWNLYAGLYHVMTKWHDVNMASRPANDRDPAALTGPPNAALFEGFIQQYGSPPNHFYSIKSHRVAHALPRIRREEPLFDTLLRRKSTRSFDTSIPLDLEALSTILHYVFGCHGYLAARNDIWVLKKTSPSGGALHPIEVYPLVMNVRGLDSGLYHYNVEHHTLELMEALNSGEAAEMAFEFTAAQSYARDAHVLFILTARFYRNFWKYRNHAKAYRVLLMDAGHLSQTLYLVCTELGLGAFVTGAINDANIEDRLGLDGFEEGVLALVGCGIPGPPDSDLDPDFKPFTPDRPIL